ncbi:MAG: response regulator transcription factor [Lentisphaeria bacterium]|nr:response regulator transcription factor [Lentisphaeria bacterium]
MAQEIRPARILVIEDENDMARILDFNLSSLGHQVTVASSGTAARAAFQHPVQDLVMLDLRLPDTSGLDLLAEIRRHPTWQAVPVIVASALGDEATVVEALQAGAEDYVVKPFRMNELMARVTGVLRRHAETAKDESEVTRCGAVEMDPATRQVLVHGMPVEFTRTEFDLLLFFARNPERVFTRRQLCDQALGSGGAVQERTIDAHIRTIRRKLGDAGRHVVTAWGVGYKLVCCP